MNKWIKRLLILLQLGGGFMGLAITLQNMMQFKSLNLSILIYVWFAGIFIMGIIAGYLILEENKQGIRLSLIYQALQIPVYYSKPISYAFSSGMMGTIYIRPLKDSVDAGVYFNFGSSFVFQLFRDNQFAIAVNVVALVLFIILLRHLKTKPNQDLESAEEAPVN